MPEYKKKYTDSFNPVVDFGDRDRRRPDDATPKVEDFERVKGKKRQGPSGTRVKPGKNRNEETAKGKKVKAGTNKSAVQTSSLASIKDFFTGQTFRWLTGILLGCLAFYLLVSFISYLTNCVHDQASILNSAVGSLPPVGNKGGEGGARLSEFLINGSFGLGSFVIILWLGALAMKLLTGWPRFKTVNFTIKCIVALITVSLIIGLVTLASDTPVNWGGYHGRYVNEFIIGFFGWIGGVVLCFLFVAAFFIICLRDFVNWVLRKRKEIADKRREAQRIRQEQEELERELAEMRMREEIDAIRAGEAADLRDSQIKDEDNPMTFSGEEVDVDPSLAGYDLEDEPSEPHSASAAVEGDVTSGYATEAADDNEESQESPEYEISEQAPASAVSEEENASDDENIDTEGFSRKGELGQDNLTDQDNSIVDNLTGDYLTGDNSAGETITGDTSGHEEDSPAEDVAQSGGAEESSEDTDRMVVNVNHIAKADGSEPAAVNQGSLRDRYKFPSSEMLRQGEHKMTVDIEEQQANKERIRETLLYHKIPITNIEATVGPTVTLYEIRPEQGVKIAKIKNLADDIALSLAAKGVRVIAPIPGKGTVGIEVANAEPQTVSMRTIIESRKYAETRYRLPVALGSTIGNDVYIADLTKMPHLLVAGATGQGKSVGLNAIIASLLYKKRPDELKFVMIDPKEVEFSLYAKIESHYLAKLEDSDAIVTDMSKVVPTLQSLCLEMDNRYKLLRTAQVRNIEEYNTKIERNQLSPSEGHRFLPYIVLIVDEFADLIMTSGKEVETPIARLAQKARAIGIHVIIATQRPSTNVITGIIKANFPVRIAFRVSSGVDSKTILDTTGAQQLIGKGDMLISNNSEMVRVQCAFIDTPEVEQICEYIERQPFNAGAYILPDPMMAEGGEGASGAVGGPESLDPLFPEVAEIVVTSGVGSTSGIQRRLSIGYNRAGKIMDQLEHYGVVGPSMGGKPRQVQMDMYGLQELLRTLGLA